MAAKKTGISRELIIHPGETIADVLELRGITQTELAAITGVTPAYVSNVVSGKKGISAKFAFSLEYALDVPKSFWLNLQANYEAEVLEFEVESSITEEERTVRRTLAEVVKYLRKCNKMPIRESIDASILSLRKALQVSNLVNLKDVVPAGAFRKALKYEVDPYVMGAWIRMCHIAGTMRIVDKKFDVHRIHELVMDLKNIMIHPIDDIQTDIKKIMKEYGIDFSVVKNFKSAPVQGYLAEKQDGTYQMVLTLRGSYADIFWFSLFHELGHIANGDLSKVTKFIDDGYDPEKEAMADLFARNNLINPADYDKFIRKHCFDIASIKKFALEQNVMPYIVIGRLQKEKYLDYTVYNDYKLRYKWAE